MPDHIRLLGDEVEAAKWVGYARGRGNGSLTSPAPGIIVRANKIGSMNILTISAEGGAFLWLFGYNYLLPESHLALNMSKKGSVAQKIFITVPGAYLIVQTQYVQIWGRVDSKFNNVYWLRSIGEDYISINTDGVYTVYNSIPTLIGTGGNQIAFYTFKGNLVKWLTISFPVGFSPTTGWFMSIVSTVGLYKGTTYLIGAEGLVGAPDPGESRLAVYKALWDGSLPTRLYQIESDYSLVDWVWNPMSHYVVGYGPLFFAAYIWNTIATGGALKVIDYPTGKVLHTWVPNAAQETILAGLYGVLSLSSRYIAAFTSTDGTYFKFYLFIWVVSDKGVSLLSMTPQNTMSPRNMSFDMKAAYEGKI